MHTRREGIAEGHAEGRAEGRVKGEAKKEAAIIEKVKNSGMSEEQINAFLKLIQA